MRSSRPATFNQIAPSSRAIEAQHTARGGRELREFSGGIPAPPSALLNAWRSQPPPSSPEVGGMMTHGAVVAREYGIPAVVSVLAHSLTSRPDSASEWRESVASSSYSSTSREFARATCLCTRRHRHVARANSRLVLE